MSLRLLVCFINFKKQDLVASCAFSWYNNQSVPYTSTDNTNLTSGAEPFPLHTCSTNNACSSENSRSAKQQNPGVIEKQCQSSYMYVATIDDLRLW